MTEIFPLNEPSHEPFYRHLSRPIFIPIQLNLLITVHSSCAWNQYTFYNLKALKLSLTKLKFEVVVVLTSPHWLTDISYKVLSDFWTPLKLIGTLISIIILLNTLDLKPSEYFSSIYFKLTLTALCILYVAHFYTYNVLNWFPFTLYI